MKLMFNCTIAHCREGAAEDRRSQPPARRLKCTDCAEHVLNALHRWEWTQVPTEFDKAPLRNAFFRRGYATMNKTLGHVRPGCEEDWCVSSLGPMAFPCGEMYVPTVEAQRDFTGTPLGVLGAKHLLVNVFLPRKLRAKANREQHTQT